MPNRLALLTLIAGTGISPAAAGSNGHTISAPPPGDAAPTDPFAETPEQRDARMAWWRQARFGMFIHWGLYSVPAGQWGQQTNHAEWIRTTAQIPLETYDQFVERFNPVKFDAAQWVRLARDAGMGYIVITSKHHDGFALYDSAVSDFDVMATPFRRDILRELADATRAEGLQMCWYHSIMDWHHPDYLPRRAWEEAARPVGDADFDRFEDYLHAQVTELLTNYGPIGVMWFDGEWESTWSEERGRNLYALCRTLQPSVIVNNRVGTGREGMMGLTREGAFGGDFGTPEQEVPATGFPGVDWESCMTMNNNWGYNAFDHNWKSTTEIIRTLVDVVSKGGNYLLNVGPRADGTFPPEAVDRLQEIRDWMQVNGESIHGTVASPLGAFDWGRCTYRPPDGPDDRATLYLHVFDWPPDGRLTVPGLANRVVDASILSGIALVNSPADGPTPRAAIPMTVEQNGGIVTLGVAPRHLGAAAMPHSTTVRVRIVGQIDVYSAPTISAYSSEFIDPVTVRLSHPRAAEAESAGNPIDLRYTIDSSDPSPTSPAYDGPLILTESATIRVQAYRGQTPLSPVATQTFTRVTAVAGVSLANPQRGFLTCEHFQGTWNAMPDFAGLNPIKVDQPRGLTLDTRTRDEHIAQRFTGYLYIRTTGVYRFGLSSDDGSRLYLGDLLVVDNDGLHATEERIGTIALSEGYHPIRIEYFNRSGGFALGLRGEMFGREMVTIPASGFVIDAPAAP